MRSRVIRGSTSDGQIRRSAFDGIRVPARPAQHVHKRVPDRRRRTRQSTSTIRGGTPDMCSGGADADHAGARPYHRMPGVSSDFLNPPSLPVHIRISKPRLFCPFPFRADAWYPSPYLEVRPVPPCQAPLMDAKNLYRK
jgi:hypothetical protein